MIATYQQLLADVLPERIDTETRYDSTCSRFGEPLVKSRLTGPEEKLMRLLGLLIEDYDRRRGMPPDDSTPAERLRFLMEHSGKGPADLLTIFGQRSHVNEAISGKRPIGVAQARKLGVLSSIIGSEWV